MCGRFTLTVDAHQIREAFPWITINEEIQPRYNIAPSQPVAVVPNDGKNQLNYFLWGLIPFWAKDPTIGNRMINARGETLDQKPSFKHAYRRRRCLVLADGFYEWKIETGGKSKIPIYIKMKNNRPFALAGLWDSWNAPDGSNILSCTIITTEPNILLKDIHNRMPVILPDDKIQTWLRTDEVESEYLKPLLMPYPPEDMIAYPVSKFVNNPVNESIACIQPIS